MIYQSNHQNPTMSSTRKTSPRPQHRKLHSTASKSAASSSKANIKRDREKPIERCRGRCRVQWSEKHVKEGLVLVQEAQLARVVKTGPISEHYEIDPKPFASGQWAKVYRCRSRSTGTLYAAKYSSRNRFNTDCSAELRHEIALLSLCSQSPRVVRLHDVYETPKEIILVMEFAPGGDLQTLIDGDLVPLEGDVVHFVKQLVEGLAYLHERNIAHLDIKPQNLVMMGSFPESEVKLCDFEISRVILEGTEVREILGTPDYVAPEILHYEPITLAADMWSLGVTTYVLLTGFSPFGGETDQETFQNISLGEVDFPEELFEDVSAQAKDFVAKLLVLDPSARMSAKQCLRHDWLRDAPTQASPHLRRYLSKSREVLLERVVSRENLRRAALLSQATSQANLSEAGESKSLGGSLSQSEMCLSYGLTGSRGSLEGSECYMSPADSRTSLGSSQTSLATSQASLATSQNYLLNKEQTQGLLSQAQSRSQAHLNHVTRRGLLSRMRSLNQIQSQACLSQSVKGDERKEAMLNPLFGSRSQEKLYGLRCLSKSQGVLDIYRSLECLRKRNRRRKDQRAVTEDVLPIFRKIGSEIASSSSAGSSEAGVNGAESSERVFSDALEPEAAANASENPERSPRRNSPGGAGEEKNRPAEEPTEPVQVLENMDQFEVHENGAERGDPEAEAPEGRPKGAGIEGLKIGKSEAEENLDSLQSVESDTLTEDSDEIQSERNRLSVKQASQRQNSDISSHSNNSANSDEKEEHSESENDEPKYSVAQLVSAFNKHQEVASKTSLEAIMTEKRVSEVTFPTGPKALRLFIPDINITERGIVRRKTSYKPRKNWEELRKQNEKNEGVLKDFESESGNEDAEEVQESQRCERSYEKSEDPEEEKPSIPSAFPLNEINSAWPMSEDSNFEVLETRECLDRRIDEKYKQCVDVAKSGSKPEASEDKASGSGPGASRVYHQKERLPNYIFAEVPRLRVEGGANFSERFSSSPKKKGVAVEPRADGSVNLKDILHKIDASRRASKENLEKLRKRTSITKIMVNDNLPIENDTNNNGSAPPSGRAKSEPPSSSLPGAPHELAKLDLPPSFVRSSSLSSESSCPTPSSLRSDIGLSWEDVHGSQSPSASLDKSEELAKASRKFESLGATKNPAENRFESLAKSKSASPMSPEERRVWGKVCTGSYTRAMQKFNGKQSHDRKINFFNSGQNCEKTRRRSSPAMPQCADS
ncbi:serine/threonine-protein kinase GIN4-like [Venturia canescens]|uniref:serine/threonine-protein kinase GIN4-like n=1 Tax=Venturia canescens TaxID=32260 RepID=UPI001C9C3B0A|nr:serine/threonine-protein kinase GIN4-like [Venturia canescens]